MLKSSLKRSPCLDSAQGRDAGAGGSPAWPASAPFAHGTISGCVVELWRQSLDGRLGFTSGIPRADDSLAGRLIRDEAVSCTDAESELSSKVD